jgi:hypothetical protein
MEVGIMSDVDILYQISKLKETDYNNTLVLTSLIEILIEKKVITRTELVAHSKRLDEYAIYSQEE